MWKLCVFKSGEVLKGFRYLETIFLNVKIVHWLCNNFTQSENCAYLNLCKRVSGAPNTQQQLFII